MAKFEMAKFEMAKPEMQMPGPSLALGPGTALDQRRSVATGAARYELAPSTVTARRFCDQQEMSLQTATGRSLP